MKNILFLGAFGAGLAGFASLGGCSASSSNQTVDTSEVDAYIQSLAQASCDWEYKCCKDAEIATLEGTKFTTKDQCLAYYKLSEEDALYLDRLAVREGRLRLDPTHSAACLKLLEGKVCNSLTPTPPPPKPAVDDCGLAFLGNTPVGSECIYAKECVDGAHCVSDSAAVGRGVCVPYQKVGDICNTDSDCDPNTANIYCAKQDYKCHVRGNAGDPCAYTLDPMGKATLPMLLECDTSAGTNLYCDDTSSTCKVLPVDGQPCLSKLPPGVVSRCNPDPMLMLVCDNPTGGTCRAPGQAGADCTLLPCATGLYCSTGASKVCVNLPTLNGNCSTSGYKCAKPYYCKFGSPNYTCSQPAALGQDCSTITCDTGLYCDPAGHLCASLLPDGSTCTNSYECQSADCVGTCQPKTTVACTGR